MLSDLTFVGIINRTATTIYESIEQKMDAYCTLRLASISVNIFFISYVDELAT